MGTSWLPSTRVNHQKRRAIAVRRPRSRIAMRISRRLRCALVTLAFPYTPNFGKLAYQTATNVVNFDRRSQSRLHGQKAPGAQRASVSEHKIRKGLQYFFEIATVRPSERFGSFLLCWFPLFLFSRRNA